MSDSSLQTLLDKIASLEQELSSTKAVLDQAATGVVRTDLRGQILEADGRFADFLGYTQKELLQKNFKEFIARDEGAADAAENGLLISNSSGFLTRDQPFLHRNGKTIWGHVTTATRLDEAGKPSMLLTTVQDIHAMKMAEEALRESLDRHRVIFDNSPMGMILFSSQGTILDCNENFINLMGSTRERLIGFNTAERSSQKMQVALRQALAGEVSTYEDAYTSVTGGKTTFLRVVFNPVTPGKSPTEVVATLEDITNRRLAEEVIAKRLLSLAEPLDNTSISFEELFNLDDIQHLQDQFAKATRVASIITRIDGTPITRPSNFTRLCRDLIRPSSKGFINCCRSASCLGRLATQSPIIEKCLSGGLLNAGAGISIGGHHIANWLIGQVRDENQSEEQIRRYAEEIGVDGEVAVQAFYEIPAMSHHHFQEIAETLFTLANRLSSTAYQNIQQARFITDLKKTRDKLTANENRLRFALEGANDGLWDADLRQGSVYFSQRSHEILGTTSLKDSDIILDWRTLVHPEDFAKTWRSIVAHFKKQQPIVLIEHRLRIDDAAWKWVLTRGKVVEWDKNGRALRLTGTLTDIDTRKKIEETLMFLLESDRSSSGKDLLRVYSTFLAQLLGMDTVGISRIKDNSTTAHTVILLQDGAFRDNFTYDLQGTPCGATLGKTVCCYRKAVQNRFPDDSFLKDMAAESYVGATLRDSRGKKLGLIFLAGRQALTNSDLAESVVKLVAIRTASELERRDAENEKTVLQAQLVQAQKMESVGRLAGGVAHDFNNMLGVILGHVEMAEEQLRPADPLAHDLGEIKKAASRSADLTRQLLTFARRQTISPKVLDLNATVESLLRMLRRLIGEDVDLVWIPGYNLWPVKIDPTQIDQILANLAVNARDAIAGVGRIAIETSNIILDDDYCADHVGFLPGQYVLMTVSDDGCGMEKEIRQNIFEPFFTTKEIGKGTGLGLATIYGIVKQNYGFINVYSEPGEGTTFKILLPRCSDRVPPREIATLAKKVVQGRETILLVEDEPSILQLGKRMLEKMGYIVLAASTPGEALQIAEHHQGEIHLLLTDVIMPEMNGRDLARRLLSLYPGMARMFMSGYTADVIAHHGILDEHVQFIEKPFSKTELSEKVRAALTHK